MSSSDGLRSGTLLASIAPQRSRLGFDPPPAQILGPAREISESPIHSTAPASALRARSGSSVARLGQVNTQDGVVVRDKAPASAKPPPLNTSSSLKRQWTQEDQDETDAQSRKKAMKDLVQSWMDRLQLISVITTFFAATEAQLLGITVPSDDGTPLRPVEQAANAGLAGALVIHVFAAILSFFAAFFLIRYRLREAKREESKVEEGSPEKSTDSHNIFSANPHLEPFGPFHRGNPPTHLLENCHTLCMWLSADETDVAPAVNFSTVPQVWTDAVFLLLVPILRLSRDFAWKYYRRAYLPETYSTTLHKRYKSTMCQITGHEKNETDQKVRWRTARSRIKVDQGIRHFEVAYNASDGSYSDDPILQFKLSFAESLPIQILMTGIVLTLTSVLVIHLLATAQYHWPLAPANFVLQVSADASKKDVKDTSDNAAQQESGRNATDSGRKSDSGERRGSSRSNDTVVSTFTVAPNGFMAKFLSSRAGRSVYGWRSKRSSEYSKVYGRREGTPDVQAQIGPAGVMGWGLGSYGIRQQMCGDVVEQERDRTVVGSDEEYEDDGDADGDGEDADDDGEAEDAREKTPGTRRRRGRRTEKADGRRGRRGRG
ncbi:hypothetical protein EUX98_g5292 [Antrodiella citrinella]|uniref:Transmembrane protein n=1 Tax=Antrodiella citrinella TaxID=2447956 RepID=A0A4S4MZQ7_9APHY|nr:hypothetical protein EUX98_g5292 [Antrodiella citrinella]